MKIYSPENEENEVVKFSKLLSTFSHRVIEMWENFSFFFFFFFMFLSDNLSQVDKQYCF